MLDINKYLGNQRLDEMDPEGNLYDLEHWSPLVAGRLAEVEGLVLDDDHWLVIFYLRQRFRHGRQQVAGWRLIAGHARAGEVVGIGVSDVHVDARRQRADLHQSGAGRIGGRRNARWLSGVGGRRQGSRQYE